MAEAKITLQTIVDDKDLKNLNEDLGKGQQEVAKIQRKIKELNKSFKDGEKSVEEYDKAMADLRKQLNQQKQINASVNKQIRETIGNLEKGTQSAKGFTNQLKELASSKVGALGVAGVAAGVMAIGKAFVDANLEMQGFINGFKAFATEAESATKLYERFNVLYRDTNFSESGVYEMSKQLMRVGYESESAEKMLRRLADAAAGLGTGEEGAKSLVNVLTRLTTAGSLSSKQLLELKNNGIDLCAIAAEKFGITYEEASEAISKGTLDNTKLIEALYENLGQFDGKMTEIKDNTVDAWGDLQGNVTELIRSTSELISVTAGYEGTKELIQDVAVVVDDLVVLSKDLTEAVRETKTEFENTFGTDTYNMVLDLCVPFRKLLGLIKEVANERNKLDGNGYSNYDSDYHDRVSPLVIPNKRGGSTGGGDGSTSKGGGGSAIDRVAQEEEKKYQAILKENEKLVQNIGNAKTKSIEISRKLFAVGKDRVDLLKEENKWAEQDAKTQTEQENKMHFDRMAHLEEQKKFYEENAGLPGSQKTLEALATQIEKENELHTIRLENISNEKDARIAANTEVLNSLGINDDPAGDVSGDSFNGVSQGLEKFMQAKEYMKSIGVEMTKLQTMALNTFGKSFASAFEAIVDGSKSAKEAFTDMVKQMLVQCLNMLAQWTAIFALVTMFKGPKVGAEAANKMVLGLKDGGYVSGAGGPRDDKVPAMLSNGEFVLNSRAVDSLGVGYLEALNSGANPVADARPIGASTVNLSVSTIDSDSFLDFLGRRGGLDSIKQAMFDDSLNFATDAGTY